jgi:hypothetical protein
MDANNKLEQQNLLNSMLHSGFDDDDGPQVPVSRAMDSDADIEAPHPLEAFVKGQAALPLAKRSGVQNAKWDEELSPAIAKVDEEALVELSAEEVRAICDRNIAKVLAR